MFAEGMSAGYILLLIAVDRGLLLENVFLKLHPSPRWDPGWRLGLHVRLCGLGEGMV